MVVSLNLFHLLALYTSIICTVPNSPRITRIIVITFSKTLSLNPSIDPNRYFSLPNISRPTVQNADSQWNIDINNLSPNVYKSCSVKVRIKNIDITPNA